MALKSNFNESRFNREVQNQADKLNEKILNSFIMAGEQFVIDARSQGQDHALGQYMDRTGNLRNSIGYYVYHNGELVKEKSIGNAVENKQIIQDFINHKGFQLIGIAGMNYASFVESKGYNVISYQADVCMINLAGYLEKLEVIEQGSAAQMEETFLP
jgi:hypothetical protein